MEGAVEMHASFLMHGDPVSARFGKFGNEQIGVLDHQVTIERYLDELAQGADYERADGDVGNEVAVHHVDVKHGAATVDGELRVSGELREIGGKNRGHEFDRHARQALLA